MNTNQKKLITIFAWFFIPLAAAFAWYKLLPENFQPASMTNSGDLLDPIFTLKPFSHKQLNGETYSNQSIEKVWTLVQFIDGECDEACSQSIYNSRQLRISLGKESPRVKRIAIITNPSGSESNKKMWASHPDLRVLLAAENGIGAQIKAQVKNISFDGRSMFLVDPLGNVVMHFADSLESKLIKKDIRKLLKLSHIG